MLAVANEKLYVNKETGFIGTGLKREEGVEYVCDCSKMDDIIVFRRDGTFTVTKVQDKCFVGTAECKELLHVGVFRKKDERTVYNMIYRDGAQGYIMVKRFAVTGIARDHEYLLTKGTKGTRVIYFTANPNGEAETITVHHVSKPGLRKVSFDFSFATLAMGNILTRNAVRNITLKDEGVSTLSARKIWFDETVKRLNVSEAGRLLGEFKGADRILTVMQGGYYRTPNFDLANHFDDDLLEIRKYNKHQILTAVYIDKATGAHYVKRFVPEPGDKKVVFLDDEAGDTLVTYSLDTFPRLEVIYNIENTAKKIESEIFEISEFIGVKGYKAKGKRLTASQVKEMHWLDPLPEPEIVDDNDDDPLASSTANSVLVEGTQTDLTFE